MKIRRIEIQGFKSFADRTQFTFGDGISSIVGPNGCGKSNIVDAIKWVLGDMSPRSLRGRRMDDVIFAGSRHRRGLGMAEVTMVLENGNGVLKTDRHDVAITRRLHRTGLSEYFLCGEKARLKDIREMFFDTGLGVDGNAIMEQGQIDALLAANPQDRRGIFEEAAGVSRYKQRRKEAEQRLQRTQENLERLLDVLELEEKRLRSLKNQAGRARRFQELRRELGKKRLLGAVLRYRAIHAERSEIQEALQQALAREREAAEELTSLEARTREAEQARLAAHEAVHAEETRIAEAAADIRAAEERIAFLRRSREELVERIGSARHEAERARERGTSLAAEARALAARVQEAASETEAEQARLAEAEAELERRGAEVAERRQRHEAAKQELVALLGRSSEAKNLLLRHLSGVRQAEDRLARAGGQRAELERRRQTVEDELAALEAEAARLATEARDRADGLAAAESRRSHLLARLRVQRDSLSALAEQRATKAARLDVLEGLARSREGLDDGARAVLEAVEAAPAEPDGSRDGVLGVLADLVHPKPSRAARLDHLLGHAAGAVVTRTAADALRWMRWLRRHHADARARFLCLDLVRPESPAPPAAVGSLGCPPGLARLVASVIGGTLLVDDLDQGIALWRESGTNAVTTGGERVTASGALLGGADGRGVLGLVERTTELRSLQTELARLAEAMARAGADVAATEKATEATEREIAILREELGRRAEDRSRGGEALSRATEERRRLLQGLEVVDAEVEDVAEALAWEHEAMAVAARRREGCEEDRRRLETEAEEARARLRAAEEAHEQASERRVEVRLQLAEARAHREAARDRVRRAAEEETGLRERGESLEREAVELGARVDQAAVGVTEAEALVARRDAERRAGGEALLRAQAHVKTLEQEAGGEEVRRREVQQLHEELRQSLEAYRLKDSELRVRIEALVEQVRQDHGLGLEEVERETPPAAEVDSATVEEDVEELRRRLDVLGNVNMNAIVELEEVQERVDFLRGQQQDLLDAKADLERVIAELNEISTARFAETFEKVREHFRETFRRLFGGGRADIVLEDASNLLESGVDIVARPPGKEQRTISLLSGGERTLTAVALLFAVFKAKPSPFAILDEVDAALDEANVRRLISLIREFTDRSQFIVVTHAKTTMESADVLYGVTMEEPGVSKKVAVELTNYPLGAAEEAEPAVASR